MAMTEHDKKMVKRHQDNLIMIRKLGGWTVRDFSDKCNVSPQTISNWEAYSSQKLMSMGNYWMVIAALGVEMAKRGDHDPFSRIVSTILDRPDDSDITDDEKKQMELISCAVMGGPVQLLLKL